VLLAGDRNRALTAYRTALAVPKRSPARPRQYQWQRDLIVSYVKMAEAEPTGGTGAIVASAPDIARTLQTWKAGWRYQTAGC
jgi:hypothetical protein